MAAVLGDERDAGTDRRARVARRDRLAEQRDRPGVVRVDAEHGPGDLAAARAHQPGESDDLARPHLERDVVELTGCGQALHVEDDVADLGRRLGEEVAHLAADHLATIWLSVVSATLSVEM